MSTAQQFEYKINPKGIQHYTKISDKYESLALQLLMSHLIEKLPHQCEGNPCPYTEDGWVSLAEVEKITVNARSLLEELYEKHEVEKREIKN
jgi:hypothetical protein